MTFKLFKRKYAIRTGSLAWWSCMVAAGGFIVAGLYAWILLAWAIFS